MTARVLQEMIFTEKSIRGPIGAVEQLDPSKPDRGASVVFYS